MKISAEITPSQLSNLLFDKFQNLNQIISNEVLDEKEKMSEKTVFAVSQCSTKLCIEILSSFLDVKDFSNATDYESKIEKLSMALTSIKSKKFVEIIPIESKTDKIVQLELFK